MERKSDARASPFKFCEQTLQEHHSFIQNIDFTALCMSQFKHPKNLDVDYE